MAESEQLTYPHSRPRDSWAKHLLKRLWLPLLLLLIYSVVALSLEHWLFGDDVTIDGSVQALASVFLGALLALRINTAYSRWWEGRTLWGGLVNVSRNLSATIAALSGLEAEDRQRACKLIGEFPGVLAKNLREAPTPTHHPSETTRSLLLQYESWRKAGRIEHVEWYRLSRLTDELLNICGGCERIKRSPLMRPFRAIVEASVIIYLMATPLAMTNHAGAVAITLVAGMFFLAMEQVANDIEEPFGVAPDDLPLEDLDGVIQRSVKQLLEH